MNPVSLLAAWVEDAASRDVPKARAMCISTVCEGRPSSRMMLVNVDHTGISFFCDARSRKAAELAGNDFACALAYWPTLARQVRVEGRVKVADRKTAERDFAGKTAAKRAAIVASRQSAPMGPFRSFDQKVSAMLAAEDQDEARFSPDHWVGYVIRPVRLEFFVGKPDRLNRRLRMDLQPNGLWRTERLYP